MIKIKDFVSILHSHGITIEGVPMNVFMDRVAAYAKTEKGKEIVSGIVNDIAHGQFSFEPAVQVGAERTLSHLKALGFEWPQISSEYLLKVVSYMENAGFLERVRSIG
jgi:hypothetical protein